ncbi:MAG: hypothetical protein U0Q18_32710 [Bryobacteraceae bacterium]
MPEVVCPTCGFRLDPINESQVVCPACGADPNSPPQPEDDPEFVPAFEDGAAFAEAPVSSTEVLGGDAPMEPQIDYVPDPDLELIIADAEALKAALTEGPVLIAGNKLVN